MKWREMAGRVEVGMEWGDCVEAGGGCVERRNGPDRAWARGVVGYKPGDSGFSVVVLF